MGNRSLSDPDYVELVAALRRLREKRDISQKHLAAKLGRSQSFVAKYESCERRLDLFEVMRICRALNTRLRDVIPSAWRRIL